MRVFHLSIFGGSKCPKFPLKIYIWLEKALVTFCSSKSSVQIFVHESRCKLSTIFSSQSFSFVFALTGSISKMAILKDFYLKFLVLYLFSVESQAFTASHTFTALLGKIQ